MNVQVGWLKWPITVVVLTAAGWMLFDGTRALVTGDYVTPKGGAHAGRLGPWSRLVASLGIDPRSTLMKSVFVGYGAAWLVTLGWFLSGARGSWALMLALAAGSLWYLWTGTALAVITIVLLLAGAALS